MESIKVKVYKVKNGKKEERCQRERNFELRVL